MSRDIYLENSLSKWEQQFGVSDPSIDRAASQERIRPAVQTSGFGLTDFLGQALWGAAEATTLETLGVADTYSLAMAEEGEEVDTWEKSIAESVGGVEGDWDQLTGWGRAGYITGQAIGSIPSFFYGGFAAKGMTRIGGGIIKGGTSILGKTTKFGVRKSAKELNDAFQKKGIKESLEKVGIKSDEKLAKEIASDSYDVFAANAVTYNLEQGFQREAFESITTSNLKNNLRDILKISDDSVLDPLSKEVFDIATRNHPIDAQKQLYLASSWLTDLPGVNKVIGHKTNSLIGAAAYDALIGVNMGMLKGLTHAQQQRTYGVERNEYGEYEYTGDFTVSGSELRGSMFHHAMTDAYHFAFIGPAKFVRGGTALSHSKQLRTILWGHTQKYWKRPSSYSREGLQQHLSALNTISDKKLSKAFKKWDDRPSEWWMKSSASKTDMQNFLKEVRTSFTRDAYLGWAKEFGVDVFHSLPRMAAGVTAMNIPSVIQQGNEYGWSWDTLKNSLGETGPEVAANIWTAMWFTRKPHSFHAPTNSKTFNKIFETGNIRQYNTGQYMAGLVNFKARQFEKSMAAVKTISAKDAQKINNIVAAWEFKKLNQTPDQRLIHEEFDQTFEFREIKNALEAAEIHKAIDGTEMGIAYNKAVAEKVKSGDIKESAVREFTNQLFIAKEVMGLYKEYSGTHSLDLKFTPETAFDFVNRVASMEFGGKRLVLGDTETLNIWKDKQWAKAAERPQKMQQDFLAEVYEILGLNYERDQVSGKMQGIEFKLDIDQFAKHGNDVRKAIIDVMDNGVTNNWLTLGKGGKEKITSEQATKLYDAFYSQSSQFMELVYGKDWASNPLREQGEVYDIISNKTWQYSFDRAVRLKQRVDGYELLTGGKDHTYEPHQAEAFMERLQRFVLYEKAPQIDKTKEGSEHFGKYQQYINDLHDVSRMVNPEGLSKKTKAPTLTLEQAKTIFDSSTALTGDLFIDSKNVTAFKTYAVQRAIDKLGLNNINLKLDYKAAAAELILDPTFNKGEMGRIELPEYSVIKESINQMRNNKVINKEYAKELIEFYDTFVQKVEKSNFPLEFKKASDGMVESADGDFVSALRRANTVGKIRMDAFLGDSQWQVHKSLGREQERMETLISSLESGVFDKDKKILVKNDKMMTELLNTRDRIRDLKNLVKEAVEERDPYMLRSLERESENIREAMRSVEMQDIGDKSLKLYSDTLFEIQKRAENGRQARAFTENSLKHEIASEIQRFGRDVTPKDVQDAAVKISTNQFKAKYKFTNQGLEKLFELEKTNKVQTKDIQSWVQEVLKDMYLDDSAEMQTWKAQNRNWVRQFETLEKTLKTLPQLGSVDLDVKTTQGLKNFDTFVRKPLVLAMEKAVQEMPANQRPSRNIIFEDAHSIAQAHFSKTVVKGVKLDLKTNTLVQTDKTVGYAKDRGFTGILEYLDPTQERIFLLEKTGVGTDGKVIRDVTGKQIDNINQALGKGTFEMIHEKGQSEAYRQNNNSILKKQNTNQGPIQDRKFVAVKLNESSSLLLRVDKAGGLSESIALNFRKGNSAVNDKGGELYKILNAVYDGELTKNTPEHKAALNLLNKLQNKDVMSVNEQIQAVKLVRGLLNFPGYLKSIVSGEGVNLEADIIKKAGKYDKMNEPKNGFIPTVENRIKSGLMYSKSESSLHRQAWNRDIVDANGNVTGKLSDWFDPTKKKGMKIASVNDEGDIIVNNKKVDNIFSSMDRAKYDFKRELDVQKDRLNRKEIGKAEYDMYKMEYELNIKAAENVGKSIVDGEMYNTFEAQLANMMFYGLNPDMVRVDANNNVVGFKSGAIKPTISWAHVETGQNNYGRVQQYYVKTAMKYDPQVEKILKKWNVDALVFKSSNKINTLKKRANEAQNEMYLEPEGLSSPGDFAKNKTWINHIERDTKVKTIDGKDMQQGGKLAGEHFVDVPFESFSIRSVAREHDPMIGQNAGVHMRHDIGIKEWIGTERKLDNYKTMYNKIHGDILERTAIAQAVLGSNSKTGDPSQINSVMSNVLLRGGIVLEPHLLRKLERDLITYNMNNGAISGGIVSDGSLDVMTADFGNLKPTTRSKIGDRDVVRLFGEFTPSYYAAQKKFKRYGDVSNGSSSEVQNVVIQRRRYIAEDGRRREADMFVIELRDGEKFVQVEGRMIDSKGRLLDIDAYADGVAPELSILNPPGKGLKNASLKVNKKVYDAAVERDNAVFKLEDGAGDKILSNKYTVSEVAETISFIKTKDTGIELSLGTLNVRQPRNMMGDVVISKIAKDRVTGDWHTDKKSGNMSRMNYLDAITPQDADFDFDKSFNYTAAPARYWSQTNKVAGIVTTTSMDKINDIFNPYGKEQFMTNKLKELLGKDATADVIEAEANMARGQFIKMHQTATYLANIYRGNGIVAEFTWNNQKMQVKLNDKGKYISTVKNIGDAAKLFIDMYKNPPSRESSEFANIRAFQNKIWFGQTGIFELHAVDKYNPFKTTVQPVEAIRDGLNNPYYAHVASTIRNTVIDPLNRYLKFNQGMMEDPSGITSKATLKAYYDAYNQMANISVNGAYGSKYMVDANVEMKSSFQYMSRYFAETSAPYDVAMKGLYQTYESTNQFRKTGNIGRSQPEYLAIEQFIEKGFNPAKPNQQGKVARAEVIDRALSEYVRNEFDALKAIDLKHKVRSLEIQLQEQNNFFRGDPKENLKAIEIQQKLSRAQEVLESIEQALSYKYAPQGNEMVTTPIKRNFESGAWRNNTKAHQVVVDYTGNIREVILAGKTNYKSLRQSDKLINNGKYFKVTDAQEQLGMRILHNAFANPPITIDSKGNHIELQHKMLKENISSDIKRINAEMMDLEKLPMQTKREKDRVYLERERILNKHLFENSNTATNENYRMALIYALLTPGISQKMIAYKSVGLDRGTKGYYYFENKHSEGTMSLLTKILNGDRVGDKGFAETMLRDIEMNKMIGYAQTKNPNLDFKMAKDRMYSANLGQTSVDITNSPVLRDFMVGPKLFEAIQAKEASTRNAAKLLIDFAQGKQVDPVKHYRASKVLEKAGISPSEQFGRTEYVTKADGSLKRHGATKLRFTEADRINRKQLGEHGGSKRSVHDWVKSLINCYRD